MSEPDKFEDDLLYAITRTGEGFRTEQSDLVAGGYQRGRRRWRRRSTVAVVGGAAALALVGTGAVYLTGSSPSSTATVSAAAAPSTAGGAGSATGSATPASASSASAAPAVTGDEVLAAFQALLPKGETTEAKGRGTNDGPAKGTFAGADLVFDDGHGKSLLQIGIQKHRKGQTQDRSCPDPKINRIDSCAVTTLADGSKLFLSQGYEYPDGRATTKEWLAVLTGPDGREIMMSEWNAAQEKGSPDSRPNPPLTLDQLKAVVTDKSWDRIVAALQPDGVDNSQQDPGLSLDDRKAVLAKLLPAGVTVTKIDGNEVLAEVQLAQGTTTGSLLLRVQKLVQQPGDPTTEKLFEGATVLPEGGRLKLYGPGTSNPKNQQMADLLRGDLRVMAAQGSTGKPLLTLDQLKAIATSPEWKLKK
ncbi:hypothetical protein P3T27_007089 [Kitasatospora sp. MAA19]|uniref:hypothetical protein n=1 Tax=Kitasatospora sp. MAA19 TaxID=3035090 RepID=UPI0024772136|nr:hypothetical protein [Kitasatospora sp. MAA19]MDH6710340.1 hypothetical protein [Kitasatospora sp. MAA19]